MSQTKQEVVEELNSIVFAYKIQISSINFLIKIAENLDEIEISVEESGQENNLRDVEIKTIKEPKNEEVNLKEQDNQRLPPIRRPSIDIKKLIEYIFNYLAVQFLKLTSKKILLRSLLIYSISIWEGFMRDYLRIVLTHNWEVLKNIKQEIKYSLSEIIEMLGEYDSIDEFRSEIVEEYLYNLLHESIDGISKKLSNLNIINLSEFNDWNVLREAYYKRNIVTHNNGIINRKYCMAVGIPDCKIGEEVEITTEYLRDIPNCLDGFIDFVHMKICDKYRLEECQS